jgi:lipopolysaccharide export system permease protein
MAAEATRVKILDRYLAASIITSMLLVMAVLLALFAFIQFVDALSDIGKADYQLADAVKYVLLSLPRQAFEIFPMAALLGTTLGLSALAADAELVAMRAAGVSLLRIVGATMKVGIILAILAVLIGEFLVPETQRIAEEGRAKALKIRITQQGDQGLWMRDGQAFVHVGEVLPDLSLLHVDIYEFDENDRLRSQTSAARGGYDPNSRHWWLGDVHESELTATKVQSRRIQQEEWNSTLTPELFKVFTVRPEGLSLLQLYRYISHLRQNHQNTGPYALAFWQKLVAPFSTVVMMVLAVPFVFGQQRSGGIGARLFTGIILGLAFFVVSRGFGYFGLLYGIPAMVGAVLPTLLFFGLAMWMLQRAR